MQLTGLWYISEMELWDEDYFNMEVQAYVEVDEQGCGKFQFGLVSGSMDGGLIQGVETEKIEFTWEGNDECDHAFGSGWLSLINQDTLQGQIKLHYGDRSTFTAKRAE